MESGLLLITTCLSGIAAVFAFIARDQKGSNGLLKIMWSLVTSLILFSLGTMVYYLLDGNFNFYYVYSHTDRSLAAVYRISALWSGQEGSFLLWGAILAVTGFFMLLWKCPNQVFGIFASISFCIFLMCLISQPFIKHNFISDDGLGMAAALKDPWMVIHPPLVFMAYSTMAVLAAHAIALSSELKSLIINRIQKWIRVSWVLLGLGIFSGSIWAYCALGWGGYWAWDPIENAALVPWLVLCGYLHKKGKASHTRCILPFSIACFGTFLTRSGILNEKSAHAYTQGNMLVTCVIVAISFIFACWLIVTKIKRNSTIDGIKHDRPKDLKGLIKDKKQVFVYIINIYAALIFLGTIAPLTFNFNTPIAFYTVISILFSLAYVVLLLGWDPKVLRRRSIWMMAMSIVVVGCIAFSTKTENYWLLLLLWISLMPLSLWCVSGFKTQNGPYYLRHIGMLLLIIGVITSNGLSKEKYIIIPQNSVNVNINRSDIAIADMMEREVMFVSTLAEDVIIQCDGMFLLSDGTLVIPCITKPMIILFWIGGFVTILSPCTVAIIQKFQNIRREKKAFAF